MSSEEIHSKSEQIVNTILENENLKMNDQMKMVATNMVFDKLTEWHSKFDYLTDNIVETVVTGMTPAFHRIFDMMDDMFSNVNKEYN
jgi:hypothetical protein